MNTNEKECDNERSRGIHNDSLSEVCRQSGVLLRVDDTKTLEVNGVTMLWAPEDKILIVDKGVSTDEILRQLAILLNGLSSK